MQYGCKQEQYVDRTPGYIVRRSKGSLAWLMFFTVSGEGSIRVNGEDFCCRKKDISIIKPGIPHYYFTNGREPWRFYWAYFMPRTTWMEWIDLPEIRRGLISFAIQEDPLHDRIKTTFDHLIEDCLQMDSIQQELALGDIEEILLLIYQKYIKVKGKTLDPRIAMILDEISLHYSEPHTIGKLAQKACLSPSRLVHLYREVMNETILDSLHKVRLEKAAQLLQMTSMSVAEVSEVVGFHSINYFSKKFKQLFGVSPSASRKQT